MTNKQKLLESVTEMLVAARAKDKDRVLELDPKIEASISLLFEDATPERNEYDNIRQSCVASLVTLPHMYDTCMADAEERYNKLFDS